MPSILERVLRVGEGRTLKKLRGYAKAVNALEPVFQQLSDAEIREEMDRFRVRHLEDGESLDDLLPEVFAAVREASVRTVGMRHFDVQLMGGAALHLGNIAEMKTGEGKTLVATSPVVLNALSGKGVHVVTVNDYLAQYQSEIMGRVYRFLGLTTGTIIAGQQPEVRRQQYAADITYGTANEFGFDYLRDNMAWQVSDLVQRGHNFSIVDEVDSILIDEARTPLIISGPASGDVFKWYVEFAKIVEKFIPGEDYEFDEKKRTVGVLEPGIEKVEGHLGIDNLYKTANTPLIGFLNNAIKAKELFKKDRDYVVMNGEVLIVDEHTGRILQGRRYNEGVHQAIEAKENVQINAENQTLATVTLQNYFRLYNKLSGMTGTAETEAAEFFSTYKLGVVPIPTNKEMVRIDQPDLVYKTPEAKYDAVIDDIKERHDKGQPVLVGTASVEKSELISSLLSKAGIRHEVLNAKNHAREAAIVAQAGRRGAVTVATNMAGRGTDIMLGGNAEFLAVSHMAQNGLNPAENPEEYEKAWPEVLDATKKAVETESQEVEEAGGLYVLGTERHESRRIDNQLRGRSGRQGDPGESRFYLSLGDDLMRLFASGAAETLLSRSGIPDDVPLESKLVSRAIQSAQRQVEARNAEQRKNVLKYDDVLNRQRTAIYGDRRAILEGDDLHEKVQHFLEDTVAAYVKLNTQTGHAEDWDLEGLWGSLSALYPVGITVEEISEEVGGLANITSPILERELISDAKVQYEKREQALSSPVIRELERRVVLSVIDRKWREHLYEMDYLKEGIGLRAMAQRDPLVEYQREGYQMFQGMAEGIKEETIGFLFNLEVQVRQVENPAAQTTVAAAPVAAQVEATKPVEEPAGKSIDPSPSNIEVDAAGLEQGDSSALQFSGPAEDGSIDVHDAEGSEVQPAEQSQPNRAARRGAAKKKKKG